MPKRIGPKRLGAETCRGRNGLVPKRLVSNGEDHVRLYIGGSYIKNRDIFNLYDFVDVAVPSTLLVRFYKLHIGRNIYDGPILLYGPKRGTCIPWTKSLGPVHVIFSWTKWGVFLGPIPVGPNQDYPAGLLRSLLSSISTWIHHYEKRFRHTAC